MTDLSRWLLVAGWLLQSSCLPPDVVRRDEKPAQYKIFCLKRKSPICQYADFRLAFEHENEQIYALQNRANPGGQSRWDIKAG
ncbi:hypothetical protein EDS67_14170 [candidate division KSB1 bacterium]|nr:MAG: hypothetical protein EDS67_14170 [candidate division KSB1 bacterium]MBC6949548.1 hypothetical protein [candidate division KSB1 bacterium]MCE7941084.1 hypothetical protein [Chlorobi bacterium CHB1]